VVTKQTKEIACRLCGRVFVAKRRWPSELWPCRCNARDCRSEAARRLDAALAFPRTDRVHMNEVDGGGRVRRWLIRDGR